MPAQTAARFVPRWKCSCSTTCWSWAKSTKATRTQPRATSTNHCSKIRRRQLPPNRNHRRPIRKLWSAEALLVGLEDSAPPYGAVANCEFVQFNHPKGWAGKHPHDETVGNFGEKRYPTIAKFLVRMSV